MAKKPMCTNPVHCAGIANPAHRAQFRHQCPFGKNCTEQSDAQHTDAFAHDMYATEQRMLVAAPPPLFGSAVPVAGPTPLFKPPGADAYYMPQYATLNPMMPMPMMPMSSAPLGGPSFPAAKASSEWLPMAGPQVSAMPVAPVPLASNAALPFVVSQAPMTGFARPNAAPQPPFPGFYLNNSTAQNPKP